MVVTVCPQLFRSKLEELGIYGLNSTGSFGRCPLCSKGIIKIDNIYWYTVCCHNSGSLIDLVAKLKHITPSLAAPIASQLLQNSAEIEVVSKASNSASQIEGIWSSCKELSTVYGLNSFAAQIGKRLEFNEQLSYISRNIHHQVRAVTSAEAAYLLKSAVSWAKDWFERLTKHPMNFVLPSYAFPGVMNGLLAYRYDVDGSVSYDALVADGETSLGLFAHKDALLSDVPLVLTSDLKLFSKLVFWQNAHSETPNSFAYIHTDGLVKSQPTGILMSRQSLYWGEDITGAISRFCYDLKIPVCSYSIQNSSVRSRDLTQLNAAKPYNTLKGRSSTVESYLASKVRQSTPQEAAITLAASLLPPSVTQVIASECSEEVSQVLQVTKYDTCDLVQTYVSGGTLEQRVDGWHLSKARSTEVICSHPFRVKEVAVDSTLIVEFFYCNQWVELVVDRSKFMANAFETVSHASAQRSLGLFTYDAAYSKNSANWCLRLNPLVDKPVNTTPLGVDIARRTITANSLQIQGYPVAMNSVVSGVNQYKKFLHLADGQMPDTASLLDVIRHKPTYSAISALVTQVIRYFNGDTPYIVTYGEKMAPMVVELLKMLDIDNSTWPCDLSTHDKSLPLLKCKAQINDTNGSMWLPIRPGSLYWITGVRDVLYLGHTLTGASRAKQRQLHRIVTCLLFETMLLNEAKPLEHDLSIVSEGWQSLLAKVNKVSGTASSVDTPQLQRVQLIDAVNYWLQHALTRGMISIGKRRQKRASITDVTVSGGQVTFRRDLINYIFTKNGLPNWNPQDLVIGLHNSPGFIAFEENFTEALLVCSAARIKLQRPSAGESATA